MLQGETTKYFWTSIDRHGKSSAFRDCLGVFWESIVGKISSPMDCKVGTADDQSEGLQVLGVSEPWPIYLEGTEECYILEPLVPQCEPRDIFLEEVKHEVDLHRGGSHTDSL